MVEYGRHSLLVKLFPPVAPLLSAVIITWLLASLDAYERFYEHSRRYETFQYDELILCLFILIILGLVWLSFHLYRKAIAENTGSQRSGEAAPHSVEIDFAESLRSMKHPLSGSYKSPWLLVMSLLGIIITAESLDMVTLHYLRFPSVYMETIVDVFFLVLLISPALFFIFLRPMIRHILIREQAEASLEQLNLELERLIDERTAQLRTELEERKRTEAKLVEHQKQLRSLASRLSVFEEQERSRIATELHDNIGHTLALVFNRIGILRASLHESQGKKIVDDIKQLVTEAIRYSRSLSSELSSPLMNYLPFVSALEGLAEDILGGTGITFDLRVAGSPEIPAGPERIILLKAISEVLVNIVKHARARTVKTAVCIDADDLVIEIKDDGIGFDLQAISPSSPQEWRGFGIFNIRERMADMNGRILITSEPGQGTTVTLSKPYTGDGKKQNS